MAKKSKPKKTARPSAVSVSEHHSVSVRKISNGYIVSKTCDKNGEYQSTERFSKTKPKINIDPGK